MDPLSRLVHLNTKECLWIYILRILKDGPTHAYTIRREIEKRFGFKPGTMTAYKVLYLLKKAGLVRKTAEGRRKIYKITPEGRKALREAVKFYKDRIKVLK
jgi:DNA-binding PadR family transcriptional regulator